MLKKFLGTLLCLSLITTANVVVHTEASYAAHKKKKKPKKQHHTASQAYTSHEATGGQSESASTPVVAETSAEGKKTRPPNRASTVVAGAAGGVAADKALSAATVDKANRVLENVKEICLSGSALKFEIDASGQLNITKTTPKGTLSASVGSTKASGGVMFNDEKIRAMVDKRISQCMERNWYKVEETLREKK